MINDQSRIIDQYRLGMAKLGKMTDKYFPPCGGGGRAGKVSGEPQFCFSVGHSDWLKVSEYSGASIPLLVSHRWIYAQVDMLRYAHSDD